MLPCIWWQLGTLNHRCYTIFKRLLVAGNISILPQGLDTAEETGLTPRFQGRWTMCCTLGGKTGLLLAQRNCSKKPFVAGIHNVCNEREAQLYNPRRRHLALGWKSPDAFERKVA
jgi:transposase InsO family protein